MARKPSNSKQQKNSKPNLKRIKRQAVEEPYQKLTAFPNDIDDEGDDDICPVCDSDCKCSHGNKQLHNNMKQQQQHLVSEPIKKRRKSRKYTAKLSPQQPADYNSSSTDDDDDDNDSLSEFSSLSGSDSDMKFLKLEERLIQKYGLESDEEGNKLTSDELSESTSVDSDTSVMEDPNELEQIWSTEDEAAVAHQTLEYLASNLDEDTKSDIISMPIKTRRSRSECKKLQIVPPPLDSSKTLQDSSKVFHQKKPVYVSPQVIQAYMAARGTPVDQEKAKYFSDLMTSGVHAEHYVPARSLKPFDGSNVKAKMGQESYQHTQHAKTVTLEDLLLIDKFDSEEDEEVKDSHGKRFSSTSALSQKTVTDLGKWNRIPIGSFRRSRRNSKPLLKLSTAVKNNFGVVPVTIHETLLGSGSARRQTVPFLENARISQHSDADNSVKSPTVSVGPPSYELGIGSTVQKKLSNKKARIMENVKKREKKMTEILRMIDSNAVEDSNYSDDFCCSCSDCDDKVPPSHETKKLKRRSRKNSLPLDDLTQLIHDPAHPPSACASPDKLFIISPHIIGENPTNTHHIDHLALEPPLISISSNKDMEATGDMIGDLPAISFSTSFPKRRRRRSSIFSAGASRIPNIEHFGFNK